MGLNLKTKQRVHAVPSIVAVEAGVSLLPSLSLGGKRTEVLGHAWGSGCGLGHNGERMEPGEHQWFL
jgi:hypothetical protein